ncbi:hypothetical protein [Actinoplanes siamensis]|uniref:Uncharacterized protein n=1 Tax=Actinoplanes siamensis TaxID=1223317 RepID=A0A919TMY6_9ACTN|nr:hypothetical protein [Actinoplanes siamensis]GIF08064.1 hypothetical protein Asi03nite_56020 [Actinoplanes siamensis]
MTDRPYNANPVPTLDHGYPGGRNVRHSMTQPRSEENRIANRPYRGHHRAEHTLHDEQTPARQRSSRVGRHHADHHADEYQANHR